MADFKDVEAQVAADEEVTDVVIYKKDGEPYLGADGQPSTIGVVGSESKRYRLNRDNTTRKMIRSGRTKMKPEDLRRNRVEIAAGGVVRWSGWELNGKPWACERDNVARLLGADHILEQVEAAIADHADFFVKSSET